MHAHQPLDLHHHQRHIQHVCPFKVGNSNDDSDRNSRFPMVAVEDAISLIMANLEKIYDEQYDDIPQRSSINIPPFRASVKDGYAIKACGGKGVKNVIKIISAGDGIIRADFKVDECFKINTGAPIPNYADCIVQVEDTKLLEIKDDLEKKVEILTEPSISLDIRLVKIQTNFFSQTFI